MRSPDLPKIVIAAGAGYALLRARSTPGFIAERANVGEAGVTKVSVAGGAPVALSAAPLGMGGSWGEDDAISISKSH